MYKPKNSNKWIEHNKKEYGVRKIPLLNKATILRLSKDIGKTKRLAIYIVHKWNDAIIVNLNV